VEFIPGEEDELSDLAAEELAPAEEAQASRNGQRGKSRSRGAATEGAQGGGRKARKKRARSGSEETAVAEGVPNQIIVNAADPEELRVAVVENDQLVDFQMTVRRHKALVNDIYRGRVVNLEPAIGAAFIDFGQGRNGFLHASDVLAAYGDKDWSLSKLLTFKVDPEEWDAESSQPDVTAEVSEDEEAAEKPARPSAKKPPRGRVSRGRRQARPNVPIADLLQKGQSVVVQITKDAIGDKGPTLTTYISIPGRYLVLMPSMSRTGVSRKIEDEKERRRLKKILQGLKNLPEGMGVIVRTAGIGCSQKDLQRDLDYLLVLWESFEKRLNLGRGPAALYEESDVAIRTVRDLFTQNTEAVIVDDEAVFNRVREFAGSLMPEAVEKIKLHTGPRPLFHTHSIEQDFERIFSRRIELPSGGSIVFDPTEALVAIDVNSGKTRSPGAEFEEIALKTNLEAAPEIARQIRLRDLGGIIVCDFIDMLRAGNRRAVERAFRLALAKDRARSKVGRISQFGLLELTRQRLGPGLSRMLFTNCPQCRGSGRVRTVESRAGAILRRLGAALTLKGFTQVEIRAVPEVIECLRKNSKQELAELEENSQRKLVLMEVPGQVEDNVLRYLRQDGREVRPGGRRRR
jgi:ribonuclease E